MAIEWRIAIGNSNPSTDISDDQSCECRGEVMAESGRQGDVLDVDTSALQGCASGTSVSCRVYPGNVDCRRFEQALCASLPKRW